MGNRRDREEKIMKKLAIIGIVFASVLLWAATAQAKPTGMSQAEYRALNQKYGVEPQQAALRVRLEEIGAWAVPATSKQMPLAHQPGQPTVGEQLREIGAWAVPSTSKTRVVASRSGEFDWNNAGIGAALVLGVAVFGAATLLAVRRHYHKPFAY
jgi:hypothetical protein